MKAPPFSLSLSLCSTRDSIDIFEQLIEGKCVTNGFPSSIVNIKNQTVRFPRLRGRWIDKDLLIRETRQRNSLAEQLDLLFLLLLPPAPSLLWLFKVFYSRISK